MKPYLSAIVILTVVSIGSATFAQEAQSSLRLKEERVKEALSAHSGQASFAGLELAGAGAAVYMVVRVRSPHLGRLDEEIAALKQKRTAIGGPTLAEAEQAYKDALKLHSTDDILANKRILENSVRDLDKLNDAALAKVENTPGQFKAAIKQQLEDINNAHVVTVEAKAAAIKQAKLNIEEVRARIPAPEVQALDIQIEDKILAREGRWTSAAYGSASTIGRRAVWAGAAIFLGYMAGKEIAVIRKDSATPHVASAEEVGQLVASLLSNQQ